MTPLLPCPFCGSIPIMNRAEPGAPYPGWYFEIHCANLECRSNVSLEAKRRIDLPEMTQDEAEAAIWEELIAQWNTRYDAPLEMKLCEASRLMLRPNQPYIFTVDPDCPSCVEAAKPYKDHGRV